MNQWKHQFFMFMEISLNLFISVITSENVSEKVWSAYVWSARHSPVCSTLVVSSLRILLRNSLRTVLSLTSLIANIIKFTFHPSFETHSCHLDSSFSMLWLNRCDKLFFDVDIQVFRYWFKSLPPEYAISYIYARCFVLLVLNLKWLALLCSLQTFNAMFCAF